jgi:hypothetical protein
MELTDFNTAELDFANEFDGKELRAANYCYARFLDPSISPAEKAAYWDAVLILRNRELRHGYLPIRNTEDDLALVQRSRHCGRLTLRGIAHDGRHQLFSRVNCKSWACPYCGPRKARRYKAQISKEAGRLKLSRLLTLTLDPKKTSPKGAVKEIKASWARFRAQLRKRYGSAPNFICVMEFQHATKLPHLHVLLDRYIEWKWAQRVWEQAGGGMHVDIRDGKSKTGFVDCHRVARYLSKYLTKELLMSAPKRSRRVTVSKGVTLNGKFHGAALYAWTLIRESIFVAYKSNAKEAKSPNWGEDAILQSFILPKSAVP